MKVDLFLKDISQDIIRNKDFVEKRIDDQCITFCCDGFCCILHCCVGKSHKWANPLDDPIQKVINPGLVIRGEEFGGLLWNTKTSKVFKLDPEAYNLFMDLEKSETIEPVLEKYHITEDELRSVLKKVGKATPKC